MKGILLGFIYFATIIILLSMTASSRLLFIISFGSGWILLFIALWYFSEITAHDKKEFSGDKPYRQPAMISVFLAAVTVLSFFLLSKIM